MHYHLIKGGKLILALTSGCAIVTGLQGYTTDDEVIVLDPYEVRSIVQGQERAIAEQRASGNYVNVVSGDEMGRFPDPNIAEALQRLPGIGIERDQGEGRYINVRGAPKEFASVTIDGINVPASDPTTRAVNLDVFASDFVTQIEVTKAIRPDQDADAIAGTVNVQTPSALATGQRRILGSIAGSYNDMGGKSDSRASLLYSDVFGSESQIGLVVGVNYSKTRREVDNIEHEGWGQTTVGSGATARDVWVFAETNFKDYETHRIRQGVNAALEYRVSENFMVFLRGFASKFEDDEFRYRLRITWEDGTLRNTAQDGFGEVERPWASYQFRHRVKTDENRSLSTGGVHAFDNFRWDYTIAYSEAEQYYPRRDELLYRVRVPLISYDFRQDPKLPEISLFNTGEHLNTDNYSFREYSRQTQDTDESEVNAFTNLRYITEMFDESATWSFGLKVRDRDKETDAERYRDRRGVASPGVTLTSFLRDDDAINYHYVLGKKHQPGLVQAYFDQVRPNAPTRNNTDGILSDYKSSEDIYSGYAMAEFRVGGMDFIAGVRAEHTRTEAEAYGYNEETENIFIKSHNRSYTNWFPGLHMKNELAQDLIMRASVTRAIARAPFGDLAPYESDNPDSRTITLGNPNLNPTLSNNYDLSLEYYLSTGGLVSVAGFYKDIKDYIITTRYNGDIVIDGVTQNYRITQPVNSPSGHIYGVELNYQQTFGFISEALSGLGFFANFTVSESESDLPDGSSTIRMPGHSKQSYNVGLFYEVNRFGVQLSYNYRSDYIQSVAGVQGRDYDTYWDGRGQLDLTANYQLTRNVQLYTEVINLTDTKGLRYVGSPERVLEYEKFGYWINFGAKFNF